MNGTPSASPSRGLISTPMPSGSARPPRQPPSTHSTSDATAPIRPTPCWPDGSAEALIRLWNAGLSAGQVARRLGKTARAIESKLRKLRTAGHRLETRRPRVPRRNGSAPRKCLYCGETFASTHAGNRLCPTCLEEGPFTSAIA